MEGRSRDQTTKAERIRRRCMTPVDRGPHCTPPTPQPLRASSRPVSAATIGEFGLQYSSFSDNDCFPEVIGAPVLRPASPMDRQLRTLARARFRKAAQQQLEKKHGELAALYNEAAATPLSDLLAPTHSISTNPFVAVPLVRKLDMRPQAYHRRIPSAALRSRPQSGLSFGNKRSATPDIIPKALHDALALPRSRESVSSSPAAQELVWEARPGSAMSVVSERGSGSPDAINALLRTRPNSALAPQPAVVYPLRSIVY